MDDPYISRAEHEEFRRRLAEENKRQDKRIEMLEENVREMRALTFQSTRPMWGATAKVYKNLLHFCAS